MVQAHMARLHFEMGHTLKPRAAITRTFVALDNAVTLVNGEVPIRVPLTISSCLTCPV